MFDEFGDTQFVYCSNYGGGDGDDDDEIQNSTHKCFLISIYFLAGISFAIDLDRTKKKP